MIKSTVTAFVAALAIAPTFSLAQDQQNEGEEQAEGQEQTDTTDGLSMGEPDGPALGDTYIQGVFSDWELRCIKTEAERDPCQLYQLLKDSTGNSVAEANFFALPQGGQAVAGANIMTPLETLLTEDVRFSVDGGKARRYPFSFCTEAGCISRMGFTAEEVDQMKRGIAAKVTIVPAAAPDRTVDVTISLAGFTAGFNALNAALTE
ncbi:MAG: invasion associated locus B family protein [Boseongicola sp.]|nr:invasion associated locus B family protein [Boseongicola sp.]MDD9976555.1 invasion associated locus B family protein [Boseongicola sp.]